MYVLVTYKNEEDLMKNEGAGVITLYSYILANCSWWLGVAKKSNLLKLLWLSLLLVRMKSSSNQKIKALERA